MTVSEEEFRRAMIALLEEGTTSQVRTVFEYVDDLANWRDAAMRGAVELLDAIRATLARAIQTQVETAPAEGKRETVAHAFATGEVNAYAMAATRLRMVIDGTEVFPGTIAEITHARNMQNVVGLGEGVAPHLGEGE